MDKIKELQGANMDTRIFMAKENDFETVKDITQTTIKLVYPNMTHSQFPVALKNLGSMRMLMMNGF